MGTLLLALPALLGVVHDDSASFSRVEVAEDAVHVTLRVQALSVLEVLPWMDRDGDKLIDAEELAVRPGELGRYLLEGYSLAEDGRRLRPEVFPDLALDPAAALPGSWVEARWSVPTGRPLAGLELSVELFLEESPGHLEFTEVTWRGVRLHPFTLGPGGGRWAFQPPSRPSVVSSSLAGLGSRADLLPLLLLAAALGCTRIGPWRCLGAALLGVASGVLWVRVGGVVPSLHALQLSAALGAGYVAADLALLKRTRAPLLEAGSFGLVIGMAYGLESAVRLEGHVHAGLQAVVELAAGASVGAVACAGLKGLASLGHVRWIAGLVAGLGLGLFAYRAL